jgi:hypothetical protein
MLPRNQLVTIAGTGTVPVDDRQVELYLLAGNNENVDPYHFVHPDKSIKIVPVFF